MNSTSKRTSGDDDYISRRSMQSAMDRQQREFEVWVLSAIALIALLVVQFVAMWMTWASETNGDDSATGWGLVVRGTPGYPKVSALLLVASVAVTFLALSDRDRRLFVTLGVFSLCRVVLAVIFVNEGPGADNWSVGPGLTMTIVAALATAAASSLVSSLTT